MRERDSKKTPEIFDFHPSLPALGMLWLALVVEALEVLEGTMTQKDPPRVPQLITTMPPETTATIRRFLRNAKTIGT